MLPEVQSQAQEERPVDSSKVVVNRPINTLAMDPPDQVSELTGGRSVDVFQHLVVLAVVDDGPR